MGSPNELQPRAGAPASGGQGVGVGLLAPRPREKEIMEPERGEELVLQIIENFIRSHPVYEIHRVWQGDRYSTIHFELKSSIDLRVSSYLRELLLLDENHNLKPIETIFVVAARGDKVIDSLRIHIDLSLTEGLSIDRVWHAIMGPYSDLGFEKLYCIEDEIRFDVRTSGSEISKTEPGGIEIYTIEACNTARLALKHGISPDEGEEE